MYKITTLSGWGQASDSLSVVSSNESTHIDYSNLADIDALFDTLKLQNPDVVIGWSLGGQLALRAISEGVITPSKLVLLATPYQFVASRDLKCAMDKESFNHFYSSFEKDPAKALKRFITLISVNDTSMHDILSQLRHAAKTHQTANWLYWLSELECFSGNMLDFSKMPATCAIHGRDDTLVDVTQTSLFKSLIKDYRLEIFDSCGHAPHLHDVSRVRRIIKEFLTCNL